MISGSNFDILVGHDFPFLLNVKSVDARTNECIFASPIFVNNIFFSLSTSAQWTSTMKSYKVLLVCFNIWRFFSLLPTTLRREYTNKLHLNSSGF